MKTTLFTSLVLLSLMSCQNDAPKESSELKGFDPPLKIAMDDFEMINRYKTDELEKLQKDLSDFLLLDTSSQTKEYDDVPDKGIIQLRADNSGQTDTKTAYTLKLVENSADIQALSSKCDSSTKVLCDSDDVLQFVKSIYTGDNDIDLFFSRGDCITVTWTKLDC